MALSLKEREVRFARAFLHALHANESNGYLLLAVIAWMRGLGSNWSGANPLGLASSSGRRLYFRSYLDAARATAARILSNQRDGSLWYGFRAIVLTAQRASSNDLQRAAQARDFLQAIALSSWDSKHFGMIQAGPYGGYQIDREHPEKNTLVAIWASLTGMHIPAAWFVDTTAPPPAPRHVPVVQQPVSGLNKFPSPNYIQPYAAREFYDGRPHTDSYVLNAD